MATARRFHLPCEESTVLLAKYPKKEKTELVIDERMQRILLALVERSPRRIWEIAERSSSLQLRREEIIPSPHSRSAIKRMNGSLVMSTKSEVEITPAGLATITKTRGD